MEKYNNPVIQGSQPKSAIFIPMIVGDEATGVISLQNNDQENAFTETDLRLLTTLANSMSVALENSRLFSETQRLLKETEQRAAELQIINTVQQGLASQLEVQAIYDLVGDEIRDIFNAQVVMISTYDGQTEMIEHRYAIERGERVYARGPHPIKGFRTQIVQTRQPVLVNTNVGEIAARLGQPTLPGTITPKSWLGVPMLLGDRVTGILSLQNVEKENAFNESDVRLLQTFAASMSIALENARLWEQENLYRKTLEREFEIGRQIQAGFLPDALPQPDGWEIAASLVSAREVAGDFYDVIELPEDTIGLVIGDVCDKGLGAALFMTLFRSLLRATSSIEFFTRVGNGEPNSTAVRLRNAISLTNNYISDIHGDTGMFATVFYGILDAHSGVLTYINAGHIPPLLVNSQGVKEILKYSGPAVGARKDAEYLVWEIRIEKGESLFAYTDGLTDTVNPSGELFNEKELLPVLNEDQCLALLLENIQTRISNHTAGASQVDDITLLAARRSQIGSNAL